MDVNEAPISINITSQGGQLSFPDGNAQIREIKPLFTLSLTEQGEDLNWMEIS